MSRARAIIEGISPRELLKNVGGPPMPDEFVRQYLETALWSSNNDVVDPEGHGHPMDDDYGVEDFSERAREQATRECTEFWMKNWRDIEDDPSRAGHDFWLTRNGHGAGFWDGDWPEEAGERLSDAAKEFGEQNIYPNEEGEVEIL